MDRWYEGNAVVGDEESPTSVNNDIPKAPQVREQYQAPGNNKKNKAIATTTVTPWYKRKAVLAALIVVGILIVAVVVAVVAVGGGGGGSEDKMVDASRNQDENHQDDNGSDDIPPGQSGDAPSTDPDDVSSTTTTTTTTEQPPDCIVGKLKTFSQWQVGFFPEPSPAETFSLVFDVQECLTKCAEAGYTSGLFDTNKSDKCVCYDYIGTCIVAYEDDLRFTGYGILFTTECPALCEGNTFCQLEPDDYKCFSLGEYDSRYFELYTKSTTKAKLIEKEEDCLKYCSDTSVAYFEYTSTSEDNKNCYCYDGVDCLTPFGDDNIQLLGRYGKFYLKHRIEVCEQDWCESYPNHWYCMTRNEWSGPEFSFQGTNLHVTASDTKADKEECMKFCASSEGGRFGTLSGGDHNCYCYDGIDCVGGSTGQYYGYLFTKATRHTCTSDDEPSGCVVGEPKSYSLQDVSAHPMEPSATYPLTTINECKQTCSRKGFTTGYYSTSSRFGDNCACYDASQVTCLTRWGDGIKVKPTGTLFTTECFDICSFDYCSANFELAECFTGHVEKHREYSIHDGGELTMTDSTDFVSNANDCQEFCASYEVAWFARTLWDDPGDKCRCYNGVQCLMPWSDLVNPSVARVADAEIYSKAEIPVCESDWCETNPDSWYCFTGQKWQANQYAFYGSDLEVAASTDVTNEKACLEFCGPYFAARYSYVSGDNSCYCFENVDCVARWGDQVGANYLSGGAIYTKQGVDECAGDYCDYFPDSWQCFTGQKIDSRQQVPYGTTLEASMKTTTERECLEFCVDYFGAVHLSTSYNSDVDNCSCFSQTNEACLADWGERVDPSQVTRGSIFSKEDMRECEQDACSMASSNVALCFSNQKYDIREYFISGDNLVSTEAFDVDTRNECWDHCVEHEVALYKVQRIWGIAAGGECICYDNVGDCLLPWGDDVDTSQVAEGEIYAKKDMPICDIDACEADPNGSLCFTGNAYALKDGAFYGENLVVAAASDTSDEAECRSFCRDHFAARYISSTYRFPSKVETCTCYDHVDCIGSYGSVDSSAFEYGKLWTKKPVGACPTSMDFCRDTPWGHNQRRAVSTIATMPPSEITTNSTTQVSTITQLSSQPLEDPASTICFSMNRMSMPEGMLYGNGLVLAASLDTGYSSSECLAFCRPHFAVRFVPNHRLDENVDSCACYDHVECVMPWSENNLFESYDYIYTREPIPTCSNSANYCDEYASDPICDLVST
eukprot:scaffold8235_cov155-Amphora_coffeaeformis.AAC.7